MRITCPNCNAQYEIGEDMIPAEGRDVQCSNCGTTWFQEGRARVATAVADRAVRHPAREAAAQDAPDDGPDDEEEDAAAAPQAGRPFADQATLDILREERALEDRRSAAPPDAAPAPEPRTPDQQAREAAAAERARMAAAAELARARDSAPRPAAETPDEPTPSEPDDHTSEAIAATMRDAAAETPPQDGAETPPPPTDRSEAPPSPAAIAASATGPRTARRELLPDIEEINSSLRPDDRVAEAEGEAAAETPTGIPPRRRAGFRLGFLATCALVLGFVAIYVFHDPLAEAVPGAADSLRDYAAWIDVQRDAFATSVEALTERIAPEG